MWHQGVRGAAGDTGPSAPLSGDKAAWMSARRLRPNTHAAGMSGIPGSAGHIQGAIYGHPVSGRAARGVTQSQPTACQHCLPACLSPASGGGGGKSGPAPSADVSPRRADAPPARGGGPAAAGASAADRAEGAGGGSGFRGAGGGGGGASTWAQSMSLSLKSKASPSSSSSEATWPSSTVGGLVKRRSAEDQ